MVYVPMIKMIHVSTGHCLKEKWSRVEQSQPTSLQMLASGVIMAIAVSAGSKDNCQGERR